MKLLAAAALAAMSLGAGAATASTLKITISNEAGDSGLSLTPLYVAFHNGSFDAFDVGTAASSGLELLAEEGDFSAIAGERAAIAGATSQGGALTAPGSPFGFGGPPVIEPGETATLRVDVASENRFFTYLSMIIPSNDLFIGNNDAIELFDENGNFLGNQTINVTEASVYDAGTEVNNNLGAAFNSAGGADTDENGVVTLAGSSALNLLTGQTGANGVTIGASPVSLLATITISEVPLPAGSLLLLSALGMGGIAARRKAMKA